mmetsp:Transcript_4983/g.12142  ORF Transcript_4983/g.12142 Transcript_4983/m.12142 type:complete len:259 (-) Transcript_4983:542-1318(-)
MPPFSRTKLAAGGTSFCREAMSEDAASLARSSSVLPRSTTPRSIAGSSKKVGHPSAGSAAAAQLMPKDATAPRPTKEFMSGAPLMRPRHPSRRICRPGPSKAAAETPAWRAVDPRKPSQCGAPCQKCSRWWTRQVEAKAPATISLRVASLRRSIRSARFFSRTRSALQLAALWSRTVVLKPTLVSTSQSNASSFARRAASSEAASGRITRTRAVSVARLTDAEVTSGTSSSVRLTRPTQPPHFMPLTSSRITSSFTDV